jgi:tetratricopeptide (TPR) repeat protein
LKKQDADRAIADFDRAINAWSDYPAAYAARASAYLGSAEFDRAWSDANNAIRLDPRLAPAYGVRAAVYAERCELDSAMSDVEQSLALNPQLAASYNIRGIIYLRRKDINRAIEDFDHALRLDSQYAPALVNLGLGYVRKNDVERAIIYFDQAVRIAPRRWTGYLGRGNAYAKKGALDRAVTDLDMAIQLEPRRAGPYHSRGYLWLQKADLDRAVSDFSRAIRLDPKYPAPLAGRGLAYERRGEGSQAIQDFKAALALPLKCGSEQWAHDTAKTRLAALMPPSSGFAAPNTPGAAGPNAHPIAPESGGAGRPPAPNESDASSQLKPVPAKSLTEALAACNREAAGVAGLTLPDPNGTITLDRCYRGPDHLMCTVQALGTEARAINQSYKEIADPHYSDVANIDAICRIDSGVVASHLEKAKSFDARWEMLSAEYGKLADCSGLVEESLRNVLLPDMRRGGDIVKSMIEKIRGTVRKISDAQKEVSALADEIEASRKALTTFQSLHASMCQRRSS